MTNVKNHSLDYKVIIVGGGPAGIAAALTLTARGISNCIIEANNIPTRKLGEALPPNSKPLLKKLGLLKLVEAPEHLPYYGNKSCWGSVLLEHKEFIKWTHGHGYLLDRLYFEKQLWAHLIKNDGQILKGHKLKKVVRTTNGVEALIENNNKTIKLKASYIVDATGRKASVCRQLGVQKHELDKQFALVLSTTLHKPVEHQIIVEATKNGWWYAAPQNNKVLTLMFFTHKGLIPKKLGLRTFLKTELEESLHLSKIIKHSLIHFENCKVMPSGTSRLDIPYGEQWVAIGDAAYSFDPISSYGITSALASGYYAANALTSVFNKQKDAMQAYHYVLENAFEAYIQKLNNHYSLEGRFLEYPFWN